jgi:hypothetical protein
MLFSKCKGYVFIMTNRSYVMKIDKVAAQIIENGGDEEAILVGLNGFADDFYRIIKTSSPGELDGYLKEFYGFYVYIKAVENLATILGKESINQQETLNNQSSPKSKNPVSDKKSSLPVTF